MEWLQNCTEADELRSPKLSGGCPEVVLSSVSCTDELVSIWCRSLSRSTSYYPVCRGYTLLPIASRNCLRKLSGIVSGRHCIVATADKGIHRLRPCAEGILLRASLHRCNR